MVRRVCRGLGNKRNIVVLNDEAHHCYRRRVEDDELSLQADDRREAQRRNEEARVWISGLEAVKRKIGVKVVDDLSATSFFLRGSGYSEGTLFPWVVSDFSLIDAIESGIVKVPPWLFPDLLDIARRWRAECLTLKDDTFPQLLILAPHLSHATERIYHAIVAAEPGEKRLLPIPKPYDVEGSTSWVRFDTVRPTYKTDPHKCHISHVVAETDSWEQKMAQTLEDMPELIRYVKNENLGFAIPYTLQGQQKKYYPDFLVHIDDGHDDPLQLIVEVTGARDHAKEAKVFTAKTLWVPSVNNAGEWGQWDYTEIRDPWDAANVIRKHLKRKAKENYAEGVT